MPTTITSAGITFNDATSLTSANGVPSALKLTTARTINGVSFDGTANIDVPASGVSAAKAWVNFDGTLSTPITPRSSYNVSSITKNGTGNYTVNFATPMANANYSFSFGSRSTQTDVTQSPPCPSQWLNDITTTTQFQFRGNRASSSVADFPVMCVQIFGN